MWKIVIIFLLINDMNNVLLRLIINDNLSSGTQLPFIERAVEQGYGVLLMNTNQNSVEHDGKDEPIKVMLILCVPKFV